MVGFNQLSNEINDISTCEGGIIAPLREFFEPKIFWGPGSVRYAASSGYRLVFLAYNKLFPSTRPVFRSLFLFSDHASGFPTTLPVFRSRFYQNQNKSAKLSSIEEISRVLNKFVVSWRKTIYIVKKSFEINPASDLHNSLPPPPPSL